MKPFRIRLLALLLAAALLTGLLPTLAAAGDLTPDYAQADAQFDALYALLRSRKAPADDETRADAAELYLRTAEGVVPGSVQRDGSSLTWMTEQGVACHFSPRLYKLATSAPVSAPVTDKLPPSIKSVSTASGRDVYVFGPYYGLDENFSGVGGVYETWGKVLARFTGGSYHCLMRNDATIDAVADALSNAAVVLLDSHGNVDERFHTSYLCLQTGQGITTADYTYDHAAGLCHAYYAGKAVGSAMSYYEVDGTAIANHMKTDASGGLIWNGVCYGMATSGFCSPLLARGVGAIYGYSQEVSFGADRCWIGAAMDALTDGLSLKTAIAEMKRRYGCWDYSIPICTANNWPSFWCADTARQAAENGNAFPLVASAEDAYPSNPDALQSVQSQWQLPRLELTLNFELPDGVKCPAISAYVFYEGLLPTPSGRPRDESRSYTFAGWSLSPVADQTARPEPLFSPGAHFRFGDEDGSNPLNFGQRSMTLYGVYCYVEGDSMFYTTQVPDGPADPYDPSALYTDMPYGTWYYSAVRESAAQGLVTGYTDGTFRPDGLLRRGELVTILYRAAGEPASATSGSFEDAPETQWFGKAVDWAAEQQLVLGYNDGLFHPDASVTRAQLAVFFWRLAGQPAPEAELSFPDESLVPDWAAQAMAWAVEQGLINGNLIGRYRYLQPELPATRAQFVAVYQRYLSV